MQVIQFWTPLPQATQFPCESRKFWFEGQKHWLFDEIKSDRHVMHVVGALQSVHPGKHGKQLDEEAM
jgi:hypothetical protein